MFLTNLIVFVFAYFIFVFYLFYFKILRPEEILIIKLVSERVDCKVVNKHRHYQISSKPVNSKYKKFQIGAYFVFIN